MTTEPLYLAARPREATAEARGWLLDAFGADAHNEIRLLNAVGIVAAVERHYVGGWQAFLTDTDNLKGDGMTEERNDMFKVESGVHGAMRINTRTFDTLAEAEAFAARIRRSNSIGSYWAEVYRFVALGGGNPHTLDGWYPVKETA